jgi:hypothetical protein
VNLSAEDVDGDGVDEIIVSKGPAYENDTVIKVFDADGEEMCRFTAFAKKRFGANVATGDIDGDGRDEIIVSPGPGQGYKPIIGIFDETGESLYTIRAEDKIVNDNGYVMILRHGLQLGAGDVDGDGIDEILIGSAHVRDYKTYVAIMDAESESSIVQHEWFLPYIIGARFGANIAAGDVNGDGVDEILTGPGPYEYSGSHLKVFDNNWELLFGSFPFKCHYGLNVASGDIDGDGVYEIVVALGPGEGNESTIKILNVLEKSEREIEAF